MPRRKFGRLLVSCGHRRTSATCGIRSCANTWQGAVSRSRGLPLRLRAGESRFRRMASRPGRAPCRHWWVASDGTIARTSGV
jgi:hypothetical protein